MKISFWLIIFYFMIFFNIYYSIKKIYIEYYPTVKKYIVDKYDKIEKKIMKNKENNPHQEKQDVDK